MSTFFQPGQAVFYLSIGRTRADLSTLTLGAVERLTRGRVVFRPLHGQPVAVSAASLTHAGWCPICEQPAHARLLLDGTLLPICPCCRLQALPVPPPEAYVLAQLSHRESSWMRFIAYLAHEGLLELTWHEFDRAWRAFSHAELFTARDLAIAA